jgi:hypothetical protein
MSREVLPPASGPPARRAPTFTPGRISIFLFVSAATAVGLILGPVIVALRIAWWFARAALGWLVILAVITAVRWALR